MNRQVLIPPDIDPALLSLPGPDFSLFKLAGETMGTSWSAQCYVSETIDVSFIEGQLNAVFADVIADFSNWDDTSLISRFNRADVGACFPLSGALQEVLRRAQALASVTGGAFNPCLGGYASQLAFQGASGTFEQGGATNPSLILNEAFDVASGTLMQPGGLQLDLSAIAKGYAVDQMAACLSALGLTSYLVEIGGEFMGRGIKQDGQPWWVDVKAAPKQPYVAALCDMAIATSATTERSYKIGGAQFHHIAGAFGDLTSVSVLAHSCAEADGWATALLAVGAGKAMQLAAEQSIPALFVKTDGRILHSPALQHFLQ